MAGFISFGLFCGNLRYGVPSAVYGAGRDGAQHHIGDIAADDCAECVRNLNLYLEF